MLQHQHKTRHTASPSTSSSMFYSSSSLPPSTSPQPPSTSPHPPSSSPQPPSSSPQPPSTSPQPPSTSSQPLSSSLPHPSSQQQPSLSSSSSSSFLDRGLYSNDIYTNVLVCMDEVWRIRSGEETDEACQVEKEADTLEEYLFKRIRSFFRPRQAPKTKLTKSRTSKVSQVRPHMRTEDGSSSTSSSCSSSSSSSSSTGGDTSSASKSLSLYQSVGMFPIARSSSDIIPAGVANGSGVGLSPNVSSSSGFISVGRTGSTVDPTLPTCHSHHYKLANHTAPSLSTLSTTNAHKHFQLENTISILLKLYQKLAKTPYKLKKNGDKSETETTSRIGDGVFFVGRVLDRLVAGSALVRKEVERILGGEDKSVPVDSSQLKKQKAKDRQQRLLNEFASKQQIFMQKSFHGKDDEEEDFEEEEEEEEEVIKCCICAQTALSTPPNPACLIALAIRTNVMGHRNSSSQPSTPFSTHHQQLHQLYHKTFGYTSSHWYDNLHIQTCGHHVHFRCYESYIKSVQSQQSRMTMPQLLFISKGEFWCPVCRQISNTILPLTTLSTPASSLHFSNNQPPITDHHFILSLLQGTKKLSLSSEMQVVDNSLVTISSSSTLHYNFYVDLFRNNIELLLMSKQLPSQQRNKSFKPLKKISLSILYRISSSVVRTHAVDDVVRILQQLGAGDQSFQDHNSCLASVDIKHLLLTILLFTPPSSQVILSTIIRYFYNLYYLQILTLTLAGLGEVELKWWLEKNKLSKVPLGALVEVMTDALKDVQAPHQDVIEDTLTERLISKLTSFLKFCSVALSSLLYTSNHTIENVETMNFKELLESVGICASQDLSNSQVANLRCYDWDDETSKLYGVRFCQHYTQLLKMDASFKSLQSLCLTEWLVPGLIDLPEEYNVFFMQYRKKAKVDENPTRSVSVCLVCSELLTGRKIELDEKIMPRHAEKCGGGVGMFLSVDSSMVTIVWQQRRVFWGSMYLDRHGEEDRDLKRGRPLYLNQERLQLLQHMWLSNSFDQYCKHWAMIN